MLDGNSVTCNSIPPTSSMASLPFVAATATTSTLKLKPEPTKHPSPSSSISLPTQKSSSVSNQRNSSISRSDGGLEPSNVDFRECNYIPFLEDCIEKNSVSVAQAVHAHIIKTGTHEDPYTMTSLLNVYGKCGSLVNARNVFDRLPTRNVVAWTAMIGAYVHNSQPNRAVQTFREMLEIGFNPTNYTFGIVLNAYSSLRSVKLLKQIHAFIIKHQFDDDNNIGNSLCTLYSKIGILESAVKAFRRVREKNVISWTAAISACGANGDAAAGMKLFSEMIAEEIEPNEFTLTSVVSLCTTMLCLSVGVQVHSLSIKLGYASNLPLRNSIMYLYLKCGWINESRRLFDGSKASLVTWNAMIIGHAHIMDRAHDDVLGRLSGAEALTIFQKLRHSGLEPDVYTYSSILSVCNNLVALQHGEQFHAQLIKTGYLSDVVVSTALANMYNKCGSVERAASAFIEMSFRTLISWTNMITGSANHGLSQQALQLFEDMRLAGVRPNPVTFVGVLSACGHAGMVSEALEYFEIMQKEYRIGPVMDHYACLVDMFVRLGQLEEAFDVVKKMNFPPSEHIWVMLISGCSVHGNLELGCYAADQLLELKPKVPESYGLLLNMYRSAGKWEEVSRTKELMREEKIGKLHDWSWICIRDKVHLFEPVDGFSPLDGDLKKLLEDLVLKAKALGYEPMESGEVSSEKLAVVFGMLKTQNGVPIRVVKSNSISRDSHSFLKYVSLVSPRKIVVRDGRRLHVFVNGQCPCGGFGPLL